ncbi:MAG: hypothetical protein IKN72_09230 [Clostridia bacterium]|nr:hypothetical protein [Clostridia bacterium]
MSKKENFAEIVRYLLTGLIIGAVNWGPIFSLSIRRDCPCSEATCSVGSSQH